MTWIAMNTNWRSKPSQQCIGRSQRFGAFGRAQRYIDMAGWERKVGGRTPHDPSLLSTEHTRRFSLRWDPLFALSFLPQCRIHSPSLQSVVLTTCRTSLRTRTRRICPWFRCVRRPLKSAIQSTELTGGRQMLSRGSMKQTPVSFESCAALSTLSYHPFRRQC